MSETKDVINSKQNENEVSNLKINYYNYLKTDCQLNNLEILIILNYNKCISACFITLIQFYIVYVIISTYIPNEILLINTLRMYLRSRAHFSLRRKKVSSQLRDINKESYWHTGLKEQRDGP